VANLSSPDAIVQAASADGMVVPEQTTYLVAPDGSAGGTGAGATGDPAAADPDADPSPISPAAWDEIKEHLAQRP
jgi:hypothetical protein